MTVISAYIDLFIRGKCPGGMSGKNCPNTGQSIEDHHRQVDDRVRSVSTHNSSQHLPSLDLFFFLLYCGVPWSKSLTSWSARWFSLRNRVARCPVFSRTVRYFGFLSGILLIVIPDNTCVNNSIVCAKDTCTASVKYDYLGEPPFEELPYRW